MHKWESDTRTEKGDDWKGMTSEGKIFSQQEMSVAIKKMKENEAAYESGAIAEFLKALEVIIIINNNNNCLKSNIQCIEIRVQWTVHLGSSHMHVHAVTRVHAVTPKLVICVMYLTSI